jgi:hypothetical protein
MTAFGQVDFNDYRPIRSQGKIPEDIHLDVLEKIKRDQEIHEDWYDEYDDLDDFFERTNIQLDNYIHDGTVRYGDPISLYAAEIADSLLVDDQDLRRQLRFYTIVSNEVNAYCTWQGMIFITTGLISELTSESQLALIIGHEIAHYTEQHQLKHFGWYKENQEEESGNYVRMGKYSKENEEEADDLGLLRFHKRGYSPDDAAKVFDMLLYAHLPFDEEPFDRSYFNSGAFLVPEAMFPEKPTEISVDGDYDDVGNSHPNIDKRKEAITSAVDTLQNWGTDLFKLGEKRFVEINNMAKFESIRCGIMSGNNTQAMYEIFLLEKEFPKSVYLKRMKAHCWLSILSEKEGGSYYREDDYYRNRDEGEMSVLSEFLGRLNFEGAQSIALRTIYDLKKELPEDDEIDSCMRVMIAYMLTEDGVDLDKYSKKTFSQAAQDFLDEQKKEKEEKAKNDARTKKQSKLDKIKLQLSSDLPQNFDSTLYYRYGMNDIVSDSSFVQRYRSQKEKESQLSIEMEEYEALTRKERDSIEEAKKDSMEVKRFIMIDPYVRVNYSLKNEAHKSEIIEREYSDAVCRSVAHLKKEVIRMDSRALKNLDESAIHLRSLLLQQLEDMDDNDNGNLYYPVDNQEMLDLASEQKAEWILISSINYRFDSEGLVLGAIAGAILYPIGSVFFPAYFNNQRQTRLNLTLYNVKTHETRSSRASFNHGISPLELEAEVSAILTDLL